MERHTTTRTALAVAVAAATLAAGCGGEGRLSKAQTASEINGALQAVNAEFQRAFEQLGPSGEGKRVSQRVRDRLKAAATVERRAADEIEAIEPVEGAEAAFDDFVRAARTQAERLDGAAARPELTVAEMADVIESAEMRDALTELVRQGLAEPPGHQ
jgi:hypothetical protein